MQRPPSETLYVDLGLPSGNRWAVANLDVTGPYYFQQSPFQYGCSYFSWGNVVPHNPISETEFDYDFGSANSESPYYEGQPYGSTPGSQLTGNVPLTMDAARRLLGGPWKIPLSSDFTELFGNCDCIDGNGDVIDSSKADKRTTVNGIVGLRLQSRLNGAIIFLPACGSGNGLAISRLGQYVVYWSATITNDRTAKGLGASPASASGSLNFTRSTGQPLRPIWNPRDLRG